jgi:hypothetical protein
MVSKDAVCALCTTDSSGSVGATKAPLVHVVSTRPSPVYQSMSIEPRRRRTRSAKCNCDCPRGVDGVDDGVDDGDGLA